MSKLILFGDSNTYGYDPRGFMGGRYPKEARWTTKVSNALAESYEVIEEGMNGRQLPRVQDAFFTNTLNQMTEEDVFVMMLGTNDILLTYNPNVAQTVDKLEQIFRYVKEHVKCRFIYIAPPYIEAVDPDMDEYNKASISMNQEFMELAEKYDIEAYDTAEWNISMGYDGVHFSVEGHDRFATMFLREVGWC